MSLIIVSLDMIGSPENCAKVDFPEAGSPTKMFTVCVVSVGGVMNFLGS